MARERTTIQVHADLLEELEEVKKELKAPSYEAAIRQVLRERRRVPESAFGLFKGSPSFRREEIDRFD